jgi:hypothetical protein
VTQPQSIERVFSRAWELLTQNWIIVVPGFVIGVVVGILKVLLTPTPIVYTTASGTTVYTSGLLATAGSSLLLGLIGLIAFIATQAFTTGMAGAAWMRGSTTLADGMAAFQNDAGRILLTALGLIVIAFFAVLLSIPTFGIAFLAFYLFTLYAFPSAVVGGRPAIAAITESFQITIARFVPTLILGIVIFVISLIARTIDAVLHIVPFLGPIVGGILTQIVVAFATLVVVGEYLNLRNSGTIAPAPGGYASRPGSYPPGPSGPTV